MQNRRRVQERRLKRRWTVVVVAVASTAGVTACFHFSPTSSVASPHQAMDQSIASPHALPATVVLKVPAQSQLPALPNGCEVTSLSMLLSAVGHPVGKLWLARHMPLDPTERIVRNGQIVYWGNPNVGFVGSVYNHSDGYGIYHGPMTRFLNTILPHRAIDLTGRSMGSILSFVAKGTPVEVWTTAQFAPTHSWVTWNSPTGKVRATMDEHAVLLVGYDAHSLLINNPLTGQQAERVPRGPFVAAWEQLGRQALTVGPGVPSRRHHA